MNLFELINRPNPPAPWLESEKLPWDDPAFSARMLKEHLNQEHDHASRRFEKIDAHVQWIHHTLLNSQTACILDLGCGPGFYTLRLGELGHTCVGIDFSPASIAYAKADLADRPRAVRPHCCYHLQDLRHADFIAAGQPVMHGEPYSLVMLTFGEFNVFRPAEARNLLEKAHAALAPGGLLLLEPQTYTGVRYAGQEERTWYTSRSGLFADKPHLCLTENFWDEKLRVATHRYNVLDAASGLVTCYGESIQAYTESDLRSLLNRTGFTHPRIFPSLSGAPDPSQSDFFVLVAQKGPAPLITS